MPADHVAGDLTREPLDFPAGRDLRLQALARGDEGFLLALGYSTQRGYAPHPSLRRRDPHRRGRGRARRAGARLSPCRSAGSASPNARWSTSSRARPRRRRSSPAATAWSSASASARRWRWRCVDRALRAGELGEDVVAPAQDEEFVISHSDNVQATGFVEHLKLPHYVDFQAELDLRPPAARRARGAAAPEARRPRGGRRMTPRRAVATYNFAYLDEQTKRMIRRAILKAIAIPGYQVPFASREMPMPYGWGTGGVQVTAAIIGPDDVLKVIDQGADDTTNAVSIRAFFAKVAGVAVTTTHRRGDDHPDPPPHPRDAARRGPDPRLPGADPRAAALPRAARDRDAQDACARGIRPDACQALRGHRPPRPHRHDLCLSGQGRGPLRDGPLADRRNSTIRRWTMSPALQLFGAGREKRIYAVPPYTEVVSLDFEDHPFEVQTLRRALRAVRRRRASISTR